MKTGIAVLAVMLAGAAVAAEDTAATVEQIVAKNIEARGGLAALKGIRSLRMTGTVSMGPAAPAGLVMEFKRPRMVRQEFIASGATGVAAFDGTVGWQLIPGAGKMVAERMSADDQREIEEQADVEGDLVDWKAKGSQVELLGGEILSGVETWKLRVTLKSGTVRTLWLDAGTFLEIQSESKRTTGGKEVEFVTTISDYRAVSGLRVPFQMETRPKWGSTGQKIVLRTVEVNVPIENSRFRMPESKPEPRPAPPAAPGS
ncbi:MAG: hypothetical protein ACHQPI_08150 [Thermoanaerobaculia bacterium]